MVRVLAFSVPVSVVWKTYSFAMAESKGIARLVQKQAGRAKEKVGGRRLFAPGRPWGPSPGPGTAAGLRRGAPRSADIFVIA